MKNLQRIYFKCEFAEKKGRGRWTALYLTPTGIQKESIPRHKKGYFLTPVNLRDISMLKLYCKAWKRHSPGKMLAVIPWFVQEVFSLVTRRKMKSEDEKENGIEAMLWAIDIGKQMMDMSTWLVSRLDFLRITGSLVFYASQFFMMTL